MTKTFATASAAIAIVAVFIGNAVAAPCHYPVYSKAYQAPAYTQVQTYTPNYNYGY